MSNAANHNSAQLTVPPPGRVELPLGILFSNGEKSGKWKKSWPYSAPFCRRTTEEKLCFI